MVEPVDRKDPARAEAVMKVLCPAARDRTVVLKRLVESAAFAEKLAPLSWSVTLKDDSFRMNVGGVEALTFGGGTVRLLLIGDVSSFRGIDVEPIQYRSVPGPQAVAYLSPKELQTLSEDLRAAHLKFIESAAISPNGKPVRSKYARAHSPGLYAYAQKVSADAT